jgi:hemoglobin/transferrin/lactoferrin receptor protein
MRKTALLSAWLVISISLYAQEDTLEKQMDEAIVYSNKFAEKKKNLAQKIDVIGVHSIARFNAQNAGDLLIATGNVFVQKSQQGGSSPVLRGFEASRVLIVIDGVRMNNAIYRSGHLQNVITVDQNMLERVEVMYGPASTIYGSDALGGVIHFRTKAPVLSGEKSFLAKGNAFLRYSSANDEKTGHADLSLGWKKFGWMQSYTYSDFGDMRMGDKYTDKYPDFGRRTRYIENINGADVIRENPDDRIQKFSGYRQWDIMHKLLFTPSLKNSHQLIFQYSNSSDIPRYDRLQDVRNFGPPVGTTLRYAEWYYGPQTRFMGAYEFNMEIHGFLDHVKLNFNYQDIKESRQQREYLRYDRFDSRREHVRVWGFNLDGRKVWSDNELNIGVDGQTNRVKSVADRTNLVTGAVMPLDSRYPNGSNQMNYLGFYVQHLRKMKQGKLILNDGIRFQVVNLHSTIADNSFFELPVTDIKQTPFAITGNLGLVYMPVASMRMTVNLSSGFRAPNIDDLARIFESSSAQQRVIVPNTEIEPEYTYNADLGFSKQFDKVRFEWSGFYTLFRNAIALAPFRLNGQDSIDYNGVRSAVFANQNVNKAFITGFNARLKLSLGNRVTFDNSFSFTYGRYKNEDGSKKPMDHIPPVFGKSSLSYAEPKLGLEFYMMYNGWKRIEDYNPDGEDNAQYATPDGMPCWITLNARAGYRFNDHLSLQLGVENLLDRNYRYFASGFSAPGRNVIISLRSGF